MHTYTHMYMLYYIKLIFNIFFYILGYIKLFIIFQLDIEEGTLVFSLSPTPSPTPSFQNNKDEFRNNIPNKNLTSMYKTSKSLIKTPKSELTSVRKNEIIPQTSSEYKTYICNIYNIAYLDQSLCFRKGTKKYCCIVTQSYAKSYAFIPK